MQRDFHWRRQTALCVPTGFAACHMLHARLCHGPSERMNPSLSFRCLMTPRHWRAGSPSRTGALSTNASACFQPVHASAVHGPAPLNGAGGRPCHQQGHHSSSSSSSFGGYARQNGGCGPPPGYPDGNGSIPAYSHNSRPPSNAYGAHSGSHHSMPHPGSCGAGGGAAGQHGSVRIDSLSSRLSQGLSLAADMASKASQRLSKNGAAAPHYGGARY